MSLSLISYNHILGGDITKLGFFILNVDFANDPRNLSILCFYHGADTAENLRAYCSDVFSQLSVIEGSGLNFSRPMVVINLLG